MPSKFKRLAAIDVGSNSLHLVIAKVSPDGKFSVLDKMKAPVRLGKEEANFYIFLMMQFLKELKH